MIIIFTPSDARSTRVAAHGPKHPSHHTPGQTPDRPRPVRMDEEEAVFSDPFGPLETSGR